MQAEITGRDMKTNGSFWISFPNNQSGGINNLIVFSVAPEILNKARLFSEVMKAFPAHYDK